MSRALTLLPLLLLTACGGKSKPAPAAPAALLLPATVQLALLNGTYANPLGTPLTFFATVTYNATGTVTFLDGSTPLATAPVGGTAASWGASLTTPLGTGLHAINAQYSGDANYLAETTGAAWNLVVIPTSAPTVTLTAAPPTVVLGSAAVLTVNITYAGIAPAAVTGLGTVAFWDGLTSIGAQVPILNGVATNTVSGLGVGKHTITATFTTLYGGTPPYPATLPVTLTVTAS